MKHKLITLFLACSCAFSPMGTQAFFDQPVSESKQAYSESASKELQANLFAETSLEKHSSSEQAHWGYFLLFVLALSIVFSNRRKRVAIPWKSVSE